MPQMPPNPDQEVHIILPRRLIIRLLEWEDYIIASGAEVDPADLALDAELKQLLRAVLALSA